MNVFADTWRQLVQRRLWPVAVLLLAALVAVPVLLAKDPAAPAPLSQPEEEPPSSQVLAWSGDPVFAIASVEDRGRRRRVLGSRKDPFAPAPAPKANAASDDASTGTTTPTDTAKPVDTSGSAVTGGGSPPSSTPPSSGGSTPPSYTPAPTAMPTPTPKKTYPVNSLIVRFGSGDSLQRMVLERLEPLPSAEEPLLVYLGLTKDRKSAIFMVDASAEGAGDGVCRPDPNVCETIELSKGETEFFDVTEPGSDSVAEYQLDLVDIKTRKTASASAAKQAYAKESKAGRRALRAHVSRSGPLRWDYDRDSGTVSRLSRDAFVAKVGRVAAAEGALAPSS
jgi:hypothetical protein